MEATETYFDSFIVKRIVSRTRTLWSQHIIRINWGRTLLQRDCNTQSINWSLLAQYHKNIIKTGQ